MQEQRHLLHSMRSHSAWQNWHYSAAGTDYIRHTVSCGVTKQRSVLAFWRCSCMLSEGALKKGGLPHMFLTAGSNRRNSLMPPLYSLPGANAHGTHSREGWKSPGADVDKLNSEESLAPSSHRNTVHFSVYTNDTSEDCVFILRDSLQRGTKTWSRITEF
jgi:hypothetical protein